MIVGEPAEHFSKSDAIVTPRIGDERIIRLQHDDEDAFASVFREYASGLLTFAWRHTGSRAIAEDIVQDVFFDLWERRSTLEHTTSLRAYLYQAVRYRVHNRYRTNDVERRYLERAAADRVLNARNTAPEHADDQVTETELRTAFTAALERIPPRSREVFVLNREHHLSYAEIAVALEISIKTVEVHMGRALALLRSELGDWMK